MKKRVLSLIFVILFIIIAWIIVLVSACTTHADCPGGACDPATHVCVASGLECNGMCTGCEICIEEACVPDDAGCGAPCGRCDPITVLCVPEDPLPPECDGGCTSDSQCPDESYGDSCLIPRCMDGTCVMVDECGSDPCEGVTCNDGNLCTTDSCNPSNGQCIYTTKNCDDDNLCTTDSCNSGNCVNTFKDCDDGDSCTSDSCNSQTGSCSNTLSCDDGDLCTDDSCSNGDCTNTPKTCDDGSGCTSDSCNSFSGNCVSIDICEEDYYCSDEGLCEEIDVPDTCEDSAQCDDGNECTADSCSGGSCVNLINPKCGETCNRNLNCIDENPCNGMESCSDNVCVSGIALESCGVDGTLSVDCFDFPYLSPGTEFTTCEHLPGCEIKPKFCDANLIECKDCELYDGDGSCVIYQQCKNSKLYVQGAICYYHGNVPGKNCVKATEACKNVSKCEDHSQWECEEDLCDVGDCVLNDKNKCIDAPLINPCKGIVCNDEKECTFDSCISTTGQCQFVEDCVSGSKCDSDLGLCVQSQLPNICTNNSQCDDENDCTADSCNNGECLNVEIADCGKACLFDSQCSDDNFCNGPEDCKLFQCLAGNVPDCKDNNECTVDSCSSIQNDCLNQPISGCVINCDSSSECDDENDCTADMCNNGECLNVEIADCGKFCILDIQCIDEVFCNGEEQCTNFDCVAGEAFDCGFGKTCDLITDTCIIPITQIDDLDNGDTDDDGISDSLNPDADGISNELDNGNGISNNQSNDLDDENSSESLQFDFFNNFYDKNGELSEKSFKWGLLSWIILILLILLAIAIWLYYGDDIKKWKLFGTGKKKKK
jgi:hypothetical protein